MTTSTLPYDRRKYVEGSRLEMNRSPEEILSERIRLWRSNNLVKPIQRIFPFHGLPGMGKSWLLFYLRDQFKEAVYIDLKERKNYPTHIEFLSEVKKKVHFGSFQKILLLIDHVPDEPGDEYLKLFEEQVIRPCYFEHGGLLIFAQQHPRNWCWNSGSISHPPALVLNGFNGDGEKKLRKKYNLPSGIKDKSWILNDTPPLLIRLESQEADAVRIAESYLKYWLEQTDPPAVSNLTKELRLAGALTWLDSMTSGERINAIIQMVDESQMDYLNVLDALSRRQWLTSWDDWVAPVRAVLNLWFRQVEPDLTNKLDTELDKRFS